MSGLIVVGGPTASGKSALALRLAEALDGVIVNADSMQLYRDLRILTARPTAAEEARVPHRLYGVLAADEVASAGRWLELAAAAIAEAVAAGRVPVVVGGTGLYLRVLLRGIAPVPDIPAHVRARTRALFARLGGAAFRAELARHDPVMAARLRPSDRQRLMRAHEVVMASGRSLADWQARPPARIALPEPVVGFAVMPPREALYARIERRLRGMLAAGALAELAALEAEATADLPVLKAVGVRPLRSHLEGALDLPTALAQAILETRHYAKRQLTWLRHQLPELEALAGFGDDAAAMPDPARLRRALLTGTKCDHSVRCINSGRPGTNPVTKPRPR